MTLEHCHICNADTATELALLSSGHVGRLCASCRTCRRFRPYASKAEYYGSSTTTTTTTNAKPRRGKGLTPYGILKAKIF